MKYTFELTGKIKPYVRMTQRGKWVRPEAQEYLDSKAGLEGQMAERMAHQGWGRLGRQPLAAFLDITVPAALHRCDIDNQLKAVLDAADGLVFANDCWVDSIMAMRALGDEYKARFIVRYCAD